MIYDEKNFIKDFAQRTFENLEFIHQAQKESHRVFEVTQLINSFLGLIVFPQQDTILRDVSISDDLLKNIKDGIVINTYQGKRFIPSSFNIIYHLRNAVSHRRLKIISFENSNEIKAINFTDIDFKDKTQKFILTMEISVIAKLLHELLKKIIGE